MRMARANKDSLLALAVIQQCTRKNVGGVMHEDLFCYSNTGEPKTIVTEFLNEVCITLKWITDEANARLDSSDVDDTNSRDVRRYDRKFQENVRTEKDRLWKSLVDVTASFIGRSNSNSNHNLGGSENGDNDDYDNDDDDNINGFDTRSTDSIATTSSNGDGSGKENNSTNGRNHHVITGVKKSLPRPFPTAHHRDQVLTFLKRARSAYGRTALCLSGGAMMGKYVRWCIYFVYSCLTQELSRVVLRRFLLFFRSRIL